MCFPIKTMNKSILFISKLTITSVTVSFLLGIGFGMSERASHRNLRRSDHSTKVESSTIIEKTPPLQPPGHRYVAVTYLVSESGR